LNKKQTTDGKVCILCSNYSPSMDRYPIHYHLYLFFLIVSSCQPVPNPVTSDLLIVKEVVDGDTFWVDYGTARGLKIRLIGIDAPETRKSAKKDIGYYGKESSTYLEKMLSGKRIRLEFDVEQYDRYKRTLAYVYLEDGTFVNAELIRQGYAMVMTIPPNVKHADEFIRLQRKARKQGKGLWGN
jgi:micrococcal nuclease